MFDKILLVSSHIDDAILGASGTIVRLKRENPKCKIWHIFFCECLEDPNNKGIIEEHLKVVKALGIDKDIDIDVPRNGYLEVHKQEVRDTLWSVKEKFNPDLVLCPSLHDFHQDHTIVAECCQTIFRRTSTILSYEVSSVTPNFKPNFYIILSIIDILKKMDTIKKYKTQYLRKSWSLDGIKSTMKMRGIQANTSWAEAFEVMWVRI